MQAFIYLDLSGEGPPTLTLPMESHKSYINLLTVFLDFHAIPAQIMSYVQEHLSITVVDVVDVGVVRELHKSLIATVRICLSQAQRFKKMQVTGYCTDSPRV